MAGASVWGNATQIPSTANADNSYKSQRFVATAGQTLFTLTNFAYQVATGSLQVFVNGVAQYIGPDFVETSNTEVSLVVPAELDDVVFILGLVGGTGNQAAAESAQQAADSAAAALASELAAAQSVVDAAAQVALATAQAVASAASAVDSAGFATDSQNSANDSAASAAASAASAAQAEINAETVGAGAFCIQYTFDTTTTDADPGPGKIRLNNATQNAATVLRADLLDNFGADWTAALGTLLDSSSTIKGVLRLTSLTNSADYLLFNVTAVASPAGYKNITITPTGSSSANPFSNGEVVYFVFNRNGDIGQQGPSGGLSNLTAITTSTTLTFANLSYHTVAMTTAGQSVTLPDATTLGGINAPKAIFDNTDGAYAFGIRDATGALVGAVAPGGVAFVSLGSISTAAGDWAIEGIGLEAGLVSIDSTLSTTFLATQFNSYVALDDNTSIHFAAIASGFAAFVVDNTGKVVNTPVTVTATANSVPVAAFRVSATTAIVFYGSATNDHRAVILSLTGSSPTLSLSVGTPLVLATGTVNPMFDGENSASAPRIVQLTSTLYSFVWQISTEVRALAFSVSGTTITQGALATLASGTYPSNRSTAYALTATTVGVIYQTGSGPYGVAAVAFSISGTTITAGTPATGSGIGVSTNVQHTTCLASATKLFATGDGSGTTSQINVVTISGTTCTWGSVFTIESVSGLAACFEYTIHGANRHNPHVWLISAGATNIVGAWYKDSSGGSRVSIVSETSGTLTTPGGILFRFAGATGGFVGLMLPQASDAIAAIVNPSATVGLGQKVQCAKISGTTLTLGRSIPAPNTGAPLATTEINIQATRLANGKTVIYGDSIGATSCSVFTTNGDQIKFKGPVSLPVMFNAAIGTNSGLRKEVAANRIVLAGNPQNGSFSNTAQQLRVLSLELVI